MPDAELAGILLVFGSYVYRSVHNPIYLWIHSSETYEYAYRVRNKAGAHGKRCSNGMMHTSWPRLWWQEGLDLIQQLRCQLCLRGFLRFRWFYSDAVKTPCDDPFVAAFFAEASH